MNISEALFEVTTWIDSGQWSKVEKKCTSPTNTMWQNCGLKKIM